VAVTPSEVEEMKEMMKNIDQNQEKMQEKQNWIQCVISTGLLASLNFFSKRI
jgi:hypothetical protein